MQLSSICSKALYCSSFSSSIISICIVFGKGGAVLLIGVIPVVILLATGLFVSINRPVGRFHRDNIKQLFSAWEDRLKTTVKFFQRGANFCIEIIRERTIVGIFFSLTRPRNVLLVEFSQE